jgi:ubiquinone/menaquinone biosynthesis C-methylase UbiE
MAEFMNFGRQPNILDPTYRSHTFRYYWARGFIEEGWNVVDSACGTGYGTEILARRAKHVTGFDRNAGCIMTAMRDHNLANISFIQHDLDNIENYNINPEAWVTIETIEHLQDPAKYAEMVRRKTKHRIILTCPIGKTTDTNPHHLHDIEIQDLHNWFAVDGWFMHHYAMQGNQYILIVYTNEYSSF